MRTLRHRRTRQSFEPVQNKRKAVAEEDDRSEEAERTQRERRRKAEGSLWERTVIAALIWAMLLPSLCLLAASFLPSLCDLSAFSMSSGDRCAFILRPLSVHGGASVFPLPPLSYMYVLICPPVNRFRCCNIYSVCRRRTAHIKIVKTNDYIFQAFSS